MSKGSVSTAASRSDPERIDPDFLHMLATSSKQIIFIIHTNHPRELDPDVIAALKQIQVLGIPLLNQSVLLKGVNDDEKTLLSLSEALIDAGIIPYYLHSLDPVQGAAHFDLPSERGPNGSATSKRTSLASASPALSGKSPASPVKSF